MWRAWSRRLQRPAGSCKWSVSGIISNIVGLSGVIVFVGFQFVTGLDCWLFYGLLLSFILFYMALWFHFALPHIVLEFKQFLNKFCLFYFHCLWHERPLQRLLWLNDFMQTKHCRFSFKESQILPRCDILHFIGSFYTMPVTVLSDSSKICLSSLL